MKPVGKYKDNRTILCLKYRCFLDCASPVTIVDQRFNLAKFSKTVGNIGIIEQYNIKISLVIVCKSIYNSRLKI